MEPAFALRPESPSWWLHPFETRMDRIVKLVVDRSCGRLRELRTRHCSDSSILNLAARCPHIEKLALVACPGVTDLSASEVAAACPKIEYLDLSECQQITCLSLELFGLHCKCLTVIRRSMMSRNSEGNRASIIPRKLLESFTSVNADQEAIVLSRLLPQLKSFIMRYSELSDQGLQALVQGCLGLEYLDFLGSTKLTRGALDNAGDTLKCLKEFIRPRLPKPSHARGVRYGHWHLTDPAYRRFHLPYISLLPLPRIVYVYVPTDMDRH